jgi:hypothetical protein
MLSALDLGRRIEAVAVRPAGADTLASRGGGNVARTSPTGRNEAAGSGTHPAQPLAGATAVVATGSKPDTRCCAGE